MRILVLAAASIAMLPTAAPAQSSPPGVSEDLARAATCTAALSAGLDYIRMRSTFSTPGDGSEMRWTFLSQGQAYYAGMLAAEADSLTRIAEARRAFDARPPEERRALIETCGESAYARLRAIDRQLPERR